MSATTRTTYFAVVRPRAPGAQYYCKITDDIDCTPPDTDGLLTLDGLSDDLLTELADFLADHGGAVVDVETATINYSIGY